ncbi:hypothetical protein [Urechidicola vernalis]|uniref:DUF1735 domain-containing protein n=1 Tax=Urechidicola vernalis TaxID=3075600 RepID=A0ABU2Y310_9FLAO|nr:hypothetical protein [Urechidicola sp. P050]MDT0552593.1 hypothetical protein [Urechidicola sp. P050]
MKKYIFIFSIVLLFSGCVSGVDFDQIEDIEVYTDHNVSLVYFKLEANDFLDDLNNETLLLSDTVSIPVFAGPYSEDYLIQADFLFKISNTFNRNITLQYEFLDENSNSLFLVNPINTTPNSVDEEYVRIISEAQVPNVIATEKFVLKVLMESGVPLDPNLGLSFNVESAVLLHYKVTAEDE